MTPVFDDSILIEMASLDEGLPLELFELFKETAPQQIARLQTFLAEKNVLAINREAHSLKSSFRGLGALRAAEVCQSLEYITETEYAADLVNTLNSEFQAATQALTDHFKKT